MRRPHVVIVGAGFGGLACARALRRAPVDVTLVERNNYHLFQPLLYQVASGLLDPSQIASPVRTILRRSRNTRVRMAEATAVDLDARMVTAGSEAIHYDFLVLASGSETDYFGLDAVRERANGLKTLNEATALRSRLLRIYETAAASDDTAARERLLTTAVVGGGPTGVEYAGALAELRGHLLPKDFPEIDFADSRVVLLEAGDRLLPTFAPRLGRAALRTLRRKGVEVRLRTAVQGMAGDALALDDGATLDAELVVWTAGVRAEALPGLEALQTERQRRVAVCPSLHLEQHPEVFVIGDLAAATQRGAVLPMLAPVAIQGGAHAARVIQSRLRGVSDPAFHYRDKGTMATIGRGAAVAQIGPIRINGLIGWLMWLFVHLLYLVGFRNRAIALWTWGWNYFFYDRPVRLITTPASGETTHARR